MDMFLSAFHCGNNFLSGIVEVVGWNDIHARLCQNGFTLIDVRTL
jgi:hypothetical protein